MRELTRRRAVTALACCLGPLLACEAGPQKPTVAPSALRPNVILLSIDTLRADRLNTYGYDRRQTSPHLDALAREGILFENFITAAPWTTPAHHSLLTSLHPSDHGVTQAFFEMYEGLYDGREFLKLPEHRITLAEALGEAGMRTAAFTGGGPLDPKLGFGQGFEEYRTFMFKLRESNMAAMFDWLEEHREEPFFLFWHHFEVHAPYLSTDFVADVLPPGEAARVRAEMESLSGASDEGVWPGGPEVQTAAQKAFLEEHGLLTREVCEALYTSGVLSADRWFGRLVERLRALELYERTMIVVTSDHGEEMAERRPEDFYDVHGHSLYEEIIRVPLIIRLPGGHGAGTRVTQVTRTVDVMPTILDVLGIELDDDQMSGYSLVAHWSDTGSPPDVVAYTEALARRHEKKSLRNTRYKYVLSVPETVVQRRGRGFLPRRRVRAQLFDLEVDPEERTNLLAAQPDDCIRELAASLDRSLREHIANHQGSAEPVRLDETTVERLRALGYAEP